MLNDIDDYQGHIETVKALQLLPYLAFRPTMLAKLEWSEVFLDGNDVNRYPHILITDISKNKGRREFSQPLTSRAVKLLKEIYSVNGTKKYVFSSIKGKPIDIGTLRKALQVGLGYDGKGKKPKQTTHGFRHIVSTILYSLQKTHKWSDVAIETVLDHEAQNKVQASYNTYDYFDVKVDMLEAVAEYLEEVKENANVINIDDVG